MVNLFSRSGRIDSTELAKKLKKEKDAQKFKAKMDDTFPTNLPENHPMRCFEKVMYRYNSEDRSQELIAPCPAVRLHESSRIWTTPEARDAWYRRLADDSRETSDAMKELNKRLRETFQIPCPALLRQPSTICSKPVVTEPSTLASAQSMQAELVLKPAQEVTRRETEGQPNDASTSFASDETFVEPDWQPAESVMRMGNTDGIDQDEPVVYVPPKMSALRRSSARRIPPTNKRLPLIRQHSSVLL